METTLRVVLQTPDTIYFDDQADWIRLETEGGELQIHPRHVNAMGSIVFSQVRIHHNNQLSTFFVRQGVVRMDNATNTVVVMAFACEKESEVTQASIREYMDMVVAQLGSDEELSEMQTSYLKEQQVSLERLLNIVTKETKNKA